MAKPIQEAKSDFTAEIDDEYGQGHFWYRLVAGYAPPRALMPTVQEAAKHGNYCAVIHVII